MTKHHPRYMVGGGECWAVCACGEWKTHPRRGNQSWAQQEFAKHLTEAKR